MKYPLLAASLAIAAVATVAPFPASARDLPTQGGPGGGPYRLECPAGAYIIGFGAATGAYVDRLSVVCGGWDSNQMRFFTVSSNLATGRQNASGSSAERNSAYCPSGYAVFGIRPWLLRSDNHLLDAMSATCASPEPPHDLYPTKIAILSEGERTFSETGDVTSRDIESDIYNDMHHGSYERDCNVGELATGIYGKSGEAIDSIGLVCQPAPQPPQSSYEAPGALQNSQSHAADALPRRHPNPRNSANPSILEGEQTTRRPDSSAQEPQVQIPDGPTPPRLTRQGMLYQFPYIEDSNGQYGLLDWCREWGSNCGEPAASAFCQTATGNANSRATNFEKFDNVGRSRHTVIASSRAVCSDPTCDTFTYVTCSQ
jgi:hypothetical protein